MAYSGQKFLYDENFNAWFDRKPADDFWVDPKGPKRTKHEYPYSYSAFYLWKSAKGNKGCAAVYSDRLEQWDYNKYKEAVAASGAKGRMSTWDAKTCGKFLTAFFGRPTRVFALAEECNVSNGFPLWIFWFQYTDAPKDTKGDNK